MITEETVFASLATNQQVSSNVGRELLCGNILVDVSLALLMVNIVEMKQDDIIYISLLYLYFINFGYILFTLYCEQRKMEVKKDRNQKVLLIKYSMIGLCQ